MSHLPIYSGSAILIKISFSRKVNFKFKEFKINLNSFIGTFEFSVTERFVLSKASHKVTPLSLRIPLIFDIKY